MSPLHEVSFALRIYSDKEEELHARVLLLHCLASFKGGGKSEAHRGESRRTWSNHFVPDLKFRY